MTMRVIESRTGRWAIAAVVALACAPKVKPGRPAAHQRPPLRAIPAVPGVRWTVNGVAADDWIPSRGSHVVQAHLNGVEREVRVEFD
jgi:hypothetical protein